MSAFAVFTDGDNPLAELTKAADSDVSYQAIVSAFLDGKSPNCLLSSHPAMNFKSHWDDLSFDKDFKLMLHHGRIVVPASAVSAILEKLHSLHQGITKTSKLARQIYFWPRMNNDIEAVVSSCSKCQELSPSQPKEPFLQTTSSRPLEHVSVDLFETKGTTYLVMVDRYCLAGPFKVC